MELHYEGLEHTGKESAVVRVTIEGKQRGQSTGVPVLP
jgi:hypothetical protein